MAPDVTPAPSAKPERARPERRAGVPAWRVGKPDAFLAGSVDFARAALVDAVDPAQVGRHLAAKSEGERLVTHLFESLRPGYRGWRWYVTLARVSRSKSPTVSELGILPSEDSVLAPEWVPWSERIRPEDSDEPGATPEREADDDAAAAGEAVEGAAAAGEAVDDVDVEAEAAGVTDIDDELD